MNGTFSLDFQSFNLRLDFEQIDTQLASTQLKAIFAGEEKPVEEDVSEQLEQVNRAIAQASRQGQAVPKELTIRQKQLQDIQQKRHVQLY